MGFHISIHARADDYLNNRREFDSLFTHQQREKDESGSLWCRWAKILERLANTDAYPMVDAVDQHIQAGLKG